MTIVKTSELNGAALDWAVAKCEKPEWWGNQAETLVTKCGFSSSTNWAQGGPIIERESISVWLHPDDNCWHAASLEWMTADTESNEFISMRESGTGDSPLIAAMRCYVASKLGDSVEIPATLLEGNHE